MFLKFKNTLILYNEMKDCNTHACTQILSINIAHLMNLLINFVNISLNHFEQNEQGFFFFKSYRTKKCHVFSLSCVHTKYKILTFITFASTIQTIHSLLHRSPILRVYNSYLEVSTTKLVVYSGIGGCTNLIQVPLYIRCLCERRTGLCHKTQGEDLRPAEQQLHSIRTWSAESIQVIVQYRNAMASRLTSSRASCTSIITSLEPEGVT